MKASIVLALMMAAVLAQPEDLYDDSSVSNTDVQELISNDRLLKSYALCFLGNGPCTPAGNKIKQLIPEAVESQCQKCSSKLKNMVRQMMVALREKLPTEWAKLMETYNTSNKQEDLDKFLAGTD